jgi:hypothetical protein
MINSLVNCEIEGPERKRSCLNFRYFSSICLKEMRKTIKGLDQDMPRSRFEPATFRIEARNITACDTLLGHAVSSPCSLCSNFTNAMGKLSYGEFVKFVLYARHHRFPFVTSFIHIVC